MTLFLGERMDESIEILRQFEPPEGYYLAFSGGKDSIVLYAMARLAAVKFDAHYNITSADPPELVRFIRKFYPTVSHDYPGTTMWKLIPRQLMPPTRLARYCCKFLKECGGEDRTVITGVKKADSTARKESVVYSCRKHGKVVVLPLLNWSDADVWDYIITRGLVYCELYDEGFTRLGCIGCPFSGPKKQKEGFERWPKYRDSYIRAFRKMLEERRKRNLTTSWKTPEDVMAWWLEDDKPKDTTIGRLIEDRWLKNSLEEK